MDERSGSSDGAATPRGVAAPGVRLPAATELGPVRLQVADLSRSEDFYRTVLGLRPASREPGRLSLGVSDGTGPLVELEERRGARPVPRSGRIGLYHFAVLLPSREALGSFAEHATGLGVRLGMADHFVSEALYLADPDGLGIEVYADRPPASWQWRGEELVMGTEPLDVHGLRRVADTGPFRGLPSGTRIGHVHLHVRDLEEAEAFYHVDLGFDKVVWSYPGALFLSAGGYHHHLGVNTWAAGAPSAGPEDARLVQWTVILPGAEHVERVAVALERAGRRVDWSGDRATVEDPWGIPVVLAGEG